MQTFRQTLRYAFTMQYGEGEYPAEKRLLCPLQEIRNEGFLLTVRIAIPLSKKHRREVYKQDQDIEDPHTAI